MGIFSSKIDVEAIEAVETDVVDLIIRLTEDEGQLNTFTKNCLLRALRVYTNKIEKENEKGYVSNHKICRMKDLIARATCKLNEFPTTDNNQPETFFTVGKQPQEIKNELFEIERIVKTSNFSEADIDSLLMKVSGCFSFISSARTALKPDETDRICVLILKLFLKSSVTNISKILDESLTNLSKISGNLCNLSANNFNSSNATYVRAKLAEISSDMNALTVISNEALEEVDKHLSFSQAKADEGLFGSSPTEPNMLDLNLLNKVKKELKECCNVLEKFVPPVGDAVVLKLQNKVKKLVFTEFDKLFSYTEEVLRERRHLTDQGMQILDKLENIDNKNKEISENLKFLKSAEEKIAVDVGSKTSFCQKRNSLELLKKKVNEIDASNNEVHLQKVAIINRLTGFILMEAINHLRQMKKTIDTYRIYAREFPFSEDNHFFQNKVKEICSLGEHMNDLPKTNIYINQRIGVIHKHLHGVLDTLKTKAELNQAVIFVIKDLDFHDSSVSDIHSAGGIYNFNTLLKLNEIRKNINSLGNFHKRVISRKVEICSKIQKIEEKIYETKFSKQLKATKLILNEYEAKALTFKDVHGSDTYNTTKKEILDLWNNIHSHEDRTKSYYKQALTSTIDIILDNLAKTSTENDRRITIKQTLEDIEKKISKPKTEEFLKLQKETLDSIKLETNDDELLNLKTNIQSKIDIEEAKLQLWDVNQRRQQLQMKINTLARPFNVGLFEDFLNELFSIKDAIDDMPEGDLQLDSYKQQLSTEIHKTLLYLDEHLGHAAKNQKQPENIVDLHNRFNKFEIGGLNVSRSSVEFVRIIRRKAESFEDCAKYYMGSSYSVDYYVIHENLLRLLEELDRVECNGDDLLKETVEAMTYIKELLDVLSSNGSSEV